jgi:hypothetical protein
MITYHARSCSLAEIADRMHRDDHVGALAHARMAFRERRINAFDLAEVFFAVGAENAKEAVTGVRRLSTCSMRRASGDGGRGS